MKTSDLFFKSILLAILSMVFVSCSDDDNGATIIDPIQITNGVYVLNSGVYQSNSATISYYDRATSKIINRIFENANGIGLGDTGQDMVIYGNKMYIAVYNSGLIYITDKNCKILNTIKEYSGNKLQPRSFDVHEDKVYVTLFDGYLARIDTTSLVIDKGIKVGPNPEGLKIMNNKIYVANSGGMNYLEGYNNTISVVDLDLTDEKQVEVGLNPNKFIVGKNNELYLLTIGDYGLIRKNLYKIDTTTDTAEKLYEGEYGYSGFFDGNKLYLLRKEYDNNKIALSKIGYFDFDKKEIVEKSFITDGTNILDINDVQFDKANGEIYVAASDGSNNGDLYIFTSEGKLKTKLDTGGAFPIGIYFINN